MPDIRKIDPLLAIAKTLLGLLIAAFAIAAVALLLGAIAAPFFEGQIIVQLGEAGKGEMAGKFTPLLSLLLVMVAVLVALMGYFMLLLWRIIDTVGHGDPFVPENARRLNLMGWISLATYAGGIGLGIVSDWIEGFAGNSGDSLKFTAEIDISGSGLVLSLVLFILARVFRHGAAMREELEGTV